MRLVSRSLTDGDAIPERYAFCRPDPETHAALSDDVSPHLAWSDAPEGTRSFAVICVDSDVPTVPDDVNQEGREVPADLPRTDFFHLVAVDVDATAPEVEEGAFGAGVVRHGRDETTGPHGSRLGINDYTAWFAGDPDMEGDYHGYDGPCPPWNDAIVHRYRFTVYALDVDRLDLQERFDGRDALAAMEGHVLDQATLTGTYTLNPRLR